MGCRTGFYLLLAGDYESADIIPLLQEMFLFIRDYEAKFRVPLPATAETTLT